ncbi:hypothetical protein I5677_15565 [Mobilitalea sibirica]|uniref:Uncharacterized protein n=1 Tax=Mobilitalea sibirica TaxID=1462919 RepID=A0A8J7HEH8_9FIRM|nr:hypothetical protein [Mobilitalea sibirica]MBH1942319.1 hypothetical protein [Mobilitalea sibirica]
MKVFQIHHKKEVIMHSCCFKRCKKCPHPVSDDEPPIAGELRNIMSGNIYISDEGTAYTFLNQLTKYPPDPCLSCETYSNNMYHIVSLSDLKNHTDWLKINDKYLYPMLVWATDQEKPVLVRISPGTKKPLKIIKKASTECLAYTICISYPSKS